MWRYGYHYVIQGSIDPPHEGTLESKLQTTVSQRVYNCVCFYMFGFVKR